MSTKTWTWHTTSNGVAARGNVRLETVALKGLELGVFRFADFLAKASPP
jgi:hypothetical protein